MHTFPPLAERKSAIFGFGQRYRIWNDGRIMLMVAMNEPNTNAKVKICHVFVGLKLVCHCCVYANLWAVTYQQSSGETRLWELWFLLGTEKGGLSNA